MSVDILVKIQGIIKQLANKVSNTSDQPIISETLN